MTNEIRLTNDNALFYFYKELDRRSKILWKTQTGQLIDIKDMTDEHLLNTIKYLQKKQAEQERLNEAYASYPYPF